MRNRKPRLFYGYIVVMAAVSILMIAWGSNRSFGVFLEPMLSEFDWTRAAISGAFTLSSIVTGVFAIIAGRLTDKFGPRVVLLVCGLFLGSNYILVSQVNAIWQFYLLYGLIGGVGMGGAAAPLMSVVARWFFRRRALMSGILTAGPALGATVMPVAFSLLIDAYGWRLSYIILGVMVLTIIVLASLFLRRDPGGMELLPYGAKEVEQEGLDLQTLGLSTKEAIQTRQFWMLSVLVFCDQFLISVVTVHLVIYAVGLGTSSTVAASVLAIAAGISIPARVIVGSVADKIGNKPSLIIVLIMSMVAFLLLLIARELWTLYLFAVLYGIGLWAAFGIMSPLTAELFGLKSHGAIFACLIMVMMLGGAIGPVLTGYIFDVSGSYQLAFIICVVVSFISLSTLILLKPITIK